MTSMTFQLFRTKSDNIAVFKDAYGKIKPGDMITDGETTVRVKRLLMPTVKTAEDNEQAAVVEIVDT